MNDQFVKVYTRKVNNASFTALSQSEVNELLRYIWIYKQNNMTEHWQVNEYISEFDNWDEFTNIRSLNDHGYDFHIQGIQPKFYAIICNVLQKEKGDGAPLLDWDSY
jgi:hypothetical protein